MPVGYTAYFPSALTATGCCPPAGCRGLSSGPLPPFARALPPEGWSWKIDGLIGKAASPASGEGKGCAKKRSGDALSRDAFDGGGRGRLVGMVLRGGGLSERGRKEEIEDRGLSGIMRQRRYRCRTVRMLCRPGVLPREREDGLWWRTGDDAGRRAGESRVLARGSAAGGGP